MADTKISALTSLSTVEVGDVIPIVDVSASETKKITRTDLVTGASHLTLANVGTNTHADIDTFIGTTVPATYAPIANPSFTGTVDIGNADTSLSRVSAGVIAVEGVTIPSISSTDTLTNKRVTKRVTTITSHATPTVNTDNCDCVTITAQAEAITSMTTNLSGTPTNFQTLLYRIKDNGTARAITWGTSFVAMGVALPTTTVISKVLTVGFIYDTVTSKWGCVVNLNEV